MKLINLYELEKSGKIKTYYCGSPKQYQYLIDNGCYPIDEYKKKNTFKTIWVFIKTTELQDLLNCWNTRSNSGGGINEKQ